MQSILLQKKHQLEVYIERLKGLSPLDKLNQGFSYVSDESGNVVTDVNRTEPGDILHIQVRNGLIKTKVIEKESVEWEQKSRN